MMCTNSKMDPPGDMNLAIEKAKEIYLLTVNDVSEAYRIHSMEDPPRNVTRDWLHAEREVSAMAYQLYDLLKSVDSPSRHSNMVSGSSYYGEVGDIRDDLWGEPMRVVRVTLHPDPIHPTRSTWFEPVNPKELPCVENIKRDLAELVRIRDQKRIAYGSGYAMVYGGDYSDQSPCR